jgi:alpha-glucosidase
MQWDATPAGGFTTGVPWLPLTDPASRNVAHQASDPGSVLSLYRRLIALRRSLPALQHGAQHGLLDLPGELVGWTREAGRERLMTLGNLGSTRVTVPLAGHGEILAATDPDRAGSVSGDVALAPNEGLVLRLSGAR